MVRVFAFFADDLSSNPAEAYSFSVKFMFEINNKRPGLAHYKLL